MMNADHTRVNPEYIRVSLRLIGQLSYDIRYHINVWKMIVHTCENDPKSDMI